MPGSFFAQPFLLFRSMLGPREFDKAGERGYNISK
jgi:hypothetical protein